MSTTVGPPAPAPVPVRAPGPPPRGPVVALRILGGLVATAVLAGGALSIAVQFLQERQVTATGYAQPVTRVVVDSRAGDVVVRPAATGAPDVVRARSTWTWTRPEVTGSVSGGVLTVTATCPARFGIGTCSADLELSVAPGTTVQVSAAAGDVRATAGVDVDAEAGTGDVRVASGEATHVRARTGTGDVVVSGTAPGARVEARTGTGDARITLGAPPSQVTVDTGTGDVSVRVPGAQAYRVSADSGAGDVRVTVPRDPAATRSVDVRAGVGDVTVRPA